MTPEQALEKRQQLLRDGFCAVDNILSDEFLRELRDETECMMEDWVPPPDFKYQGQHVTARGEDNPTIQNCSTGRLRAALSNKWAWATLPARAASSS